MTSLKKYCMGKLLNWIKRGTWGGEYKDRNTLEIHSTDSKEVKARCA